MDRRYTASAATWTLPPRGLESATTWHRMTAADVRELLQEAEALLRAGDPWGASARVRLAARQAGSIDPRLGDDLEQEVALAVERVGAAEEAARGEVKRRHALHVANERRAAGITDEITDVASVASTTEGRRRLPGRRANSPREGAADESRSPVVGWVRALLSLAIVVLCAHVAYASSRAGMAHGCAALPAIEG